MNNEPWWEWQERQTQEWILDQRMEMRAFAETPEGRWLIERYRNELHQRLNAELREIGTEDQGEPFDTEANETT